MSRKPKDTAEAAPAAQSPVVTTAAHHAVLISIERKDYSKPPLYLRCSSLNHDSLEVRDCAVSRSIFSGRDAFLLGQAGRRAWRN